MAAVGSPIGAGPYDQTWALMAQRLVATGQADCVLRGNHELNLGNGDVGMGRVLPGEEADYIQAWRRWHGVLRANGFRGTICWNPIPEQNGMALWDVRGAYPGDAFVDQIGLDVYDGYYRGWQPGGSGTQAPPTAAEKADKRSYWLTHPIGLNYWRGFAAARGKSLAFPEWGLRLWREGDGLLHGGGDHPEFIQMMYDFIHDPAYPPGAPGGVAWHAPWEHGTSNGLAPKVGAANPDEDRSVPVPASRALFLRLFGGA